MTQAQAIFRTEADLGAAMQAAARKEGHRGRLPEGPRALSKVQAARVRRILAMLRRDQPRTVREVSEAIDSTHPVASHLLKYLISTDQAKRVDTVVNGRTMTGFIRVIGGEQ